MAAVIMMKNPNTGSVKQGFYGFSWTTLFFTGIPALLRKDIFTGILTTILGVWTLGLVTLIWAFFYNKVYTIRLLKAGYIFDDNDDVVALALSKLGITAEEVLAFGQFNIIIDDDNDLIQNNETDIHVNGANKKVPGSTKKVKRTANEEVEFYKSLFYCFVNFIRSQQGGDFWINVSTKLAAKLVGSDSGGGDGGEGEDEKKCHLFWTNSKKAALFLLLAVLSFTSVFNFVINNLPITGNIISVANKYLDLTTKHALETFAVLRVANATISVLKDSKCDVDPGGIGITADPGEALQPAEDIVEQASTIMLLSVASLGIQKILIKIGCWIGSNIMLGISFILLFIGVCIFKDINITRIGLTIILISMITTLIIPVTDYAVKVISDQFLETEYQNAFAKVNTFKADDATLDKDSSNQSSSIWREFKNKVNSIISSLNMRNIRKKIDYYESWAKDAVTYVLELIIVFLMQTVIFPLTILFMLLKLAKSMFPSK